MSKTYEMYLNKAHILIDGLKRNLNVVSEYGISPEELRDLENEVCEAEKMNEDVDRKRAELKVAIPRANEKLSQIKEVMSRMKRVVKHQTDPSQWTTFGILDKR